MVRAIRHRMPLNVLVTSGNQTICKQDQSYL